MARTQRAAWQLVLLLSATSAMCGASRAAAAGLSYDELESCMRSKVAALALTRKVDDERAALDAQKQALAAGEDGLSQARAGLDRRNGAAVADYNQRVDRHEAAGRAFNDHISEFNSNAAAATRLAREYADQCAERPFKAEDVERLPTELREAAGAGVVNADDYARARARATASP